MVGGPLHTKAIVPCPSAGTQRAYGTVAATSRRSVARPGSELAPAARAGGSAQLALSQAATQVSRSVRQLLAAVARASRQVSPQVCSALTAVRQSAERPPLQALCAAVTCALQALAMQLVAVALAFSKQPRAVCVHAARHGKISS